MIVGEVVGTTWATRRHDSLRPYRMLLVKHKDPVTGETSGIPYLDKDIDAGIGDTVLMLDDGGSARIILEDDMAPVRAMVVGVVDDVSIDEDTLPTS
ncbi:MAG: EutN/CcmL family microcompartment protein [bacterium]